MPMQGGPESQACRRILLEALHSLEIPREGIFQCILQKLRNAAVPWVWNNWRWQVLSGNTSHHPEQPRYRTKVPQLGPPWNPLEAERLQAGDALFLARPCCLCGSLSVNRSSEEKAELSIEVPGTQQMLTCLKILPGTRQSLKKKKGSIQGMTNTSWRWGFLSASPWAQQWRGVRRRGRTGPWEGARPQSPLQLVYAPPCAGSSPLTSGSHEWGASSLVQVFLGPLLY